MVSSDSKLRSREIDALPVLTIFIVALPLHFAWEVAQMPLFRTEDAGIGADLEMCAFATFTGDFLFTITIYLTVAVIHRDLMWASKSNAYSHPATWSISIFVGLLLGVSFELWAVYVAKRWTYGSMPLVPVLRVGITPLLQMTFIPVVALVAAGLSTRRRSRRRER